MENAALELANNGFKVDVITFDETVAGSESRREDFNVHRVRNPVGSQVNIVTWALTLGTEMQRAATDVIAKSRDDAKLVHASEWLCVSPAVQLKQVIGTPFTFSLYATESERSPSGPLNASISYLELKGCTEATRILVRNKKTREILQKSYGVPADRSLLLEPPSHTLSHVLRQVVAELTASKVNSAARK
jgi:hypothetical protein